MYREEIYSLQILLSRTQAGPGRQGCAVSRYRLGRTWIEAIFWFCIWVGEPFLMVLSAVSVSPYHVPSNRTNTHLFQVREIFHQFLDFFRSPDVGPPLFENEYHQSNQILSLRSGAPASHVGGSRVIIDERVSVRLGIVSKIHCLK